MDALTKIRLRTMVWLIVPVLVVVVLPHWLSYRFDQPRPWRWGLWQVVGIWLIANGVGLAAWCVNLFNVQGQGTPLPFDPPKQFVAAGPYRFVRNPMMLGAFLVIVGEAAMFQSCVLACYLLILMGLAHLVVRSLEEPQLIRRFGQPYREYQHRVPRWIPRLPGRGR